MTNMRERGMWRRYISAAIAAACLSNDRRMPGSWQERELLGCAGSPS
jgi:hypothetical protein